jgi:hypothetical protein
MPSGDVLPVPCKGGWCFPIEHQWYQELMMNSDEFRQLVGDMREAQKRYFKERLQRDLERSKALERIVDAELRDNGQGEMFGEEKNAYWR